MIYILIIILGMLVIYGNYSMTVELERLRTEVAESNAVMDSAVTLISDLAQKIRDNLEDTAALTDLADALDTNANKLAAAIASNTASGEEPTEEELEPIEE